MGLFDRRKREKPDPEVDAPESLEDVPASDHEDDSANLYRAMFLNAVAAGDDVLLQLPDEKTPAVLPAFELDLLAQCNHFASIEDHSTIAAQRTGLPEDGVLNRLYELTEQGLLISQFDLLTRARAAAQGDSDEGSDLHRVSVITSNRPASLANCLESYRNRYGGEIELAVFDDSADPAVREENRRIAARFADGARVSFAGQEEKQRFVVELCKRSGVDPDIVQSGLTEFEGVDFHCGGNQNSVLLDASGGAVLMVDDDTTTDAAFPQDAAVDELRLSSRYDPWSVRFFSRVEEALDQADWSDVDILSWHRRLLGRSPAQGAFSPKTVAGLDGWQPGLDLNDADTALLVDFTRARGRVVVTAAGVAGDSGMGVPLYLLTMHGENRERFLANYEQFRATRAMHRGANALTISNSNLFMAAHVAFDLRNTLPPFPPLLRNNDGVFGAVLRMSSTEDYVAFLPLLIRHNSPDVRPSSFDAVVQSAGRVRANDIIRDVALGFDPAPGVIDAKSRLRAFGQYLTALGDMKIDDFGAFVRHHILSIVGRRIDTLTRIVDQEGGQPAAWAEDCAAVAGEGLRSLRDDELVVADLSGASAEDRHRKFQRTVRRYGQLLDAWPALLDSSRDMRVAQSIG